MRIGTRQIVIAGVMGAIAILLGATGWGFIPFVLGVSITIMHVPVIIGAVLEGPLVGTVIGLLFGIFSLIWAFIRPSGPDIYFQHPLVSVLPRLFIGLVAYLVYRVVRGPRTGKASTALGVVVVLAVTSVVLAYATPALGDDAGLKRLVLLAALILIALAVVGLYLAWRKLGEVAAIGAAAVAGTLTNTVLVLSMLGWLSTLGVFDSPLPWSVLLTIGVTNGVPEIIAAVLITVAVVAAWKQIEVGRKGARVFRAEAGG